MNVLAMGRMLQSQIGASQDLPLAGPSTFLNATGQYLEFFNWLRMAYKQIQEDQMEWNWRTKQGVINLAATSAHGSMTGTTNNLFTTPDNIFDNSMVGSQITVIGAGAGGTDLTTTIGSVTAPDNVRTAVVNGTSVSTASVYAAGKYVFSVADIQKQTGALIRAPIATNQEVGPTDMSDYEDAIHLHFIDDQRYGLVWDLTIGVADQTFCRFIPYQDWRGWKDRNVIPPGKPAFYTRRPDLSLEFNPIPNKATLCFSFDYKSKLDDFPNTSDLPNAQSDTYTPLYMPPTYHEAIVWRAMMFWGMQRQNPAKYDVAKDEYQKIMNKMYVQYLAEPNFYGAEYYGGY